MNARAAAPGRRGPKPSVKYPCLVLRKWLWENEMTYAEFGAAVGVSAVAVWKWIWIGYRPHDDTMKRVISTTEGEITARDWTAPRRSLGAAQRKRAASQPREAAHV